jgi:hypothetical protein
MLRPCEFAGLLVSTSEGLACRTAVTYGEHRRQGALCSSWRASPRLEMPFRERGTKLAWLPRPPVAPSGMLLNLCGDNSSIWTPAFTLPTRISPWWLSARFFMYFTTQLRQACRTSDTMQAQMPTFRLDCTVPRREKG